MKKKIIFILCFLVIFFTLFLVNRNYISPDAYYNFNKIYLASADESNKTLFAKVKTLQEYAKKYITESNVDRDPVDLCLDFIRKDRYNDYMWKMTIGAADENFIQYVNQQDPNFKFKDPEYIIDKATGDKIDFIHLAAALSANYTPNGVVDPSYAGWSGDLMTVLEEFVIYRMKNNITDKNKLQEYANSLIGTDKPSTMDKEDALANLDSLTMLENSSFRTDLYQTLMDYYVNNKGTYCSKNRFKNAQNSFGSRDKLKAKAIKLIGDENIQGLLIPDTKSKITSSDVEMVSIAFTEYVYREPYITLSSENEIIIPGETNKVSLSGRNIDNIILTYNNEIVNVTNSGAALNIKGLKVGKTDITISSTSNVLKGTISVEVKNIAPTILNDLPDSIAAKLDENAIFKLETEGTNNIYTWYISDDGSENWEVHSITKIPELTITAALALNTKFFKCGIKNDGNEEIFSKISMLNIEGLNPEIETDLPSEETIKFGENHTFIFTVSGDDNTYTWYLSESLDDIGKELQVTETSEITIEGNADYNNKYLKCVITNTKTGKAITTPVKIIIDGIPVAEKPFIPPVKEDSNILIPIIIVVSIIVTLLVILIIVKSKKKKTENINKNDDVINNDSTITSKLTNNNVLEENNNIDILHSTNENINVTGSNSIISEVSPLTNNTTYDSSNDVNVVSPLMNNNHFSSEGNPIENPVVSNNNVSPLMNDNYIVSENNSVISNNGVSPLMSDNFEDKSTSNTTQF